VVLASDIVIGAAGFLGFLSGIEARQGIILGKSAAKDAAKAQESRILATSMPGDCSNRSA
jgi:hypothetical protein